MWTAATVLDLVSSPTRIACLLIALTNDRPQGEVWADLISQGTNTAVLQVIGVESVSDARAKPDDPFLVFGAEVTTAAASKLRVQVFDYTDSAITLVGSTAAYVFGWVDEAGWVGPDGWSPGQTWRSEFEPYGWTPLTA
jgi:hypothetical protein